MSRKDFELIARVIREARIAPDAREEVAIKFADELRATNINFQRGRFLDACLPR